MMKVEAEFLIKTDVFIHHQGQFFSPDSRFILSLTLLIFCSFFQIHKKYISKYTNKYKYVLTRQQVYLSFDDSNTNTKIFIKTQHSSTVFRARVDIAPQNYVKIAVNHEVSLGMTL